MKGLLLVIAAACALAGCGEPRSALSCVPDEEVVRLFETRDAARLRALVAGGVGPRERFEGLPLSVVCALRDWPEGIEILAEAGYDLDARGTRDGFRLAALHYCAAGALPAEPAPQSRRAGAKAANERLLGALLAHGADPDLPGTVALGGATLREAPPLALAVAAIAGGGDPEEAIRACELLVANGAKVDARFASEREGRALRGLTPLMLATLTAADPSLPREAQDAALAVCRLLVGAGADVSALATLQRAGRAERRSALAFAVAGEDPNVVRLLLGAGADPDQPLGRGVTPRALAEAIGNRAVARLLP